ncbi:MAG TPA: hypothetical protein VNC50_13080 [Planctomycetia bacterium]|nr:hypothetical protein [Planctomycetia bacterium]
MRRARRIRSRNFPRRALALAAPWLALCSHLVLVAGLPLPARRDASVPYPCMSRPCGCQSARQCWTSCRCFSPAERVLWAKERGIAVPEFAVLPTATEMEALLTRNSAGAEGESCCCAKDADHSPSCCAAPKPKASAPSAEEDGDEMGWRLVVGPKLAGCFGLSDELVKCGAVVPPPVPVQLSPLEGICELSITATPMPAGRRDAPPVPPPEV